MSDNYISIEHLDNRICIYTRAAIKKPHGISISPISAFKLDIDEIKNINYILFWCYFWAHASTSFDYFLQTDYELAKPYNFILSFKDSWDDEWNQKIYQTFPRKFKQLCKIEII